MREVLATEMLEALGVNTSKTFAVFETGEALERGDERLRVGAFPIGIDVANAPIG